MTKQDKINFIKNMISSINEKEDLYEYAMENCSEIKEDIVKHPENKKYVYQIKELINSFKSDEEMLDYIERNCPAVVAYFNIVDNLEIIEKSCKGEISKEK